MEKTQKLENRELTTFMFLFSLLIGQSNLLQGSFARSLKYLFNQFYNQGVKTYNEFGKLIKQDSELVEETLEKKDNINIYLEIVKEIETSRDIKGLLQSIKDFNYIAELKNPKLKFTEKIAQPKVLGKIELPADKKKK